jgi:LPS sulfotransferase NodH
MCGAIETHRCRNGFLSYKIHADQHRQLSADLGQPWEDALPNVTIIRLRRRDIVGQAVSLGAALQTGIWDDASAELLKRPSALNEAVAEKWVEYIFRSERYWDRYLKRKHQRILSLDCEDLADADKLEATLSGFGTGHSNEAIGNILKRLPRSSHNSRLSHELAQRFWRAHIPALATPAGRSRSLIMGAARGRSTRQAPRQSRRRTSSAASH